MSSVSRRKAAIGTFVGSGGNSLIAAIQSIALLPMYLGAAGVESYGLWLATGEILLWLVAFDCGIPTVMIQRISAALADRRESEIGQMFASALAILAIVATVLGVGAAVSASYIVQSLAGRPHPELVLSLQIAAGATALVIIGYGFQGLARALQRTWALNICSMASTLLGFVVTYILLKSGFGLPSIACGLAVRSSGSVLAGIVLWAFAPGFAMARAGFRPCKRYVSDYAREMPALLTSGIAYALMNNSQVFIANLFLGPKVAVLISVSRKLAEFAKSILDMSTYATEAGLGHLFATKAVDRTRHVLKELEDRFLALTGIMMGGYLAINATFVPLWTAGAFQPSIALTAAIAIGTSSAAWCYAGISRLRANGRFRTASGLLLADCAARVALINLGAGIGNEFWLVCGSILPPIICGTIARRKLSAISGQVAFESHSFLAFSAAWFVLGGTVSALASPHTWWSIALVGLAVAGFGTLVALMLIRRPQASQTILEVPKAA